MKPCGLGEGPHHLACDCREAAVLKLVEAAKRVDVCTCQYGVPCPACDIKEALKHFTEKP